MIRQLYILTLFWITFINATLTPTCGKNEEYRCGSVCVETCNYKPSFCVKICRYGCHCKEGFVRRSNETGSPCIRPQECRITPKPLCGLNEEFVECANPCPLTCNFWRYPVPKVPVLCRAACRPGCTCKEGFYRSDDWKCIPREQCCGRNENFNRCGTACVETCDFKPTICTKQCVPGCFCKNSNFVRLDNTTNSICVPRRECSNCETDEDEYY